MFDDLARTDMNLQQLMLSRGFSLRSYRNFVGVLWTRRPDWKAAYLQARSARVLRLGVKLLDTPEEKLIAMGRRGVRRELFMVEKARPVPVRRAEAREACAARALIDPIYGARQRAKRPRSG